VASSGYCCGVDMWHTLFTCTYQHYYLAIEEKNSELQKISYNYMCSFWPSL